MDNYNLIGFWLTGIGTFIGIISLIYAIYISKTAKDIKNRMLNIHIQNDYKRSKHSILKELTINYSMIKENSVIQHWDINERLTDLNMYRSILSKDSLKLIKRLKKLINNKKSKVGYLRKKNSDEIIGKMLYSLIAELQNDFNEKENWLEVITK